MIEEQYVSFETAKLAKEKKVFIEGCCEVYSQEGGVARTPNGGKWNWEEYDKSEFCLRPTQSLLARWIREKHNIHIDSYPNASGYLYYINKTNGTLVYDSDFDGPNDGGAWNSYEEAMESGLQEALKII